MGVLDGLKASWTIGGLHAPIFAWIAALLLLVCPLILLARLWIQVRRECRRHADAIDRLGELRDVRGTTSRSGLTDAECRKLASIFADSSEFEQGWQRLEASRMGRVDGANEERWWFTDSPAAAFDEARLVEHINKGLYHSMPGIITGAGLLFTFIAILVALMDVRIINDQVQGLDTLIKGLSGKFVSSIAALIAATIFSVFQQTPWHRLTTSRRKLVDALDRVAPQLTPTLLLADLTRDASDQAAAFKHFNSDLSLKLRQSMSESMGPTLERMLQTLEELGQVLRVAEAQKHESMTSSLEGLLHNLQTSITTSLEAMSSHFVDSLAGSANQELDKVTAALSGTAGLLESMNLQFAGTQQALSEIVTFARSAATEQVALGKSQVEELTSVLHSLMTQLQETAGSSLSQMAGALTTLTADLSQKVEALSDQMSTTMLQSATTASGVAQSVVEQASTWSTQTAKQFSELLEHHAQHSDRIAEVRATLDATLSQFKTALTQYGEITKEVRQVTAQLASAGNSVTTAAAAMRDTQQASQQVAKIAAEQVGRFETANKNQAELWHRLHAVMKDYEHVFGQVKVEAGELLAQIADQLQNYRNVARQSMQELITASNGHFADATNKLGSSVSALDDYLQDLMDTLDRFKDNGSGGKA